MPNFEQWCLAILVAQGFAVCYWEWRVYVLHNERFTERKQWRLAKQKQQLKKDNPSRVGAAENQSFTPSEKVSLKDQNDESVKSV